MKIRTATSADTEAIILMLEHYKLASPLELHKTTGDATARIILDTIFKDNRGIIFLAEKDQQVVGMLIAIKNINMWNKDAFCMNELAYWVEPEHRGSSAGYRLLKAYSDAGLMMKQAGEIEYFTISKMITSPDLNYKIFGFNKLEETWSN